MLPLLVIRISPSDSFVEPADREDALLVANEFDDIAFDRTLGGAGDAHRLVERDVDMFAATELLGLAHAQRLAIHQHGVFLADHRAGAGGHAIDGHPPFADQAIGLAA